MNKELNTYKLILNYSRKKRQKKCKNINSPLTKKFFKATQLHGTLNKICFNLLKIRN
jgi:hypothetical protein